MSQDPHDLSGKGPTPPDTVHGASVRELLRSRDDIDRALRDRYERKVAVLLADLSAAEGARTLGDVEGDSLLMRYLNLLAPVVEQGGGRIVKTAGNALLALFGKPADAVQASVQMQLKLVEHRRMAGSNEPQLHLRIGINAGPSFVEPFDPSTDTVVTAAAVQSAARINEVLISDVVKHAVEGEMTFGFSPANSIPRPGKLPLLLYEVAWRDVTRRPIRHDKPHVDMRYRVADMLGSGGMAAVWKAFDERLTRPVAIKVLHRHLDLTEVARERFRREARTAASLVHENVVQVFDFAGDGAEESYIAMELVEGKSLRSYLTNKGPLPDVVAAAIAHEVARGLAHAHAHGVIHRDVKPDNVLLGVGGSIKIGDFGIAGVMEATRLTVSGAAVGSPAYMAPEQLEGLPPSPSNDVFGLGVTLYEMATGRPPFDGQSPATVLRLVSECKFEDPRKFAPVGAALCTIILKAMAKEPRERYVDAGEMATDLRRLLDARGVGDPRAALARFMPIEDPVALAAAAADFEVSHTAPGKQKDVVPQGWDMTYPSGIKSRPSISAKPAISKRGLAMVGGIALAAALGLAAGAHSREQKPVLPDLTPAVPTPLRAEQLVAPTPVPTPNPPPIPSPVPNPIPVPVAVQNPAPVAPTPKPVPVAVVAPAPVPEKKHHKDPAPVVAKAPAKTPVKVTFRIVPWGDLSVDGSLRAHVLKPTPLTLDSGPHLISVSHTKLETLARSIDVPSDGDVTVVINLIKKTITLQP